MENFSRVYSSSCICVCKREKMLSIIKRKTKSVTILLSQPLQTRVVVLANELEWMIRGWETLYKPLFSTSFRSSVSAEGHVNSKEKTKQDLVSQERITLSKFIMIETVLCLIMDTRQWASTFTALDKILAT